MKYIKDFNKFKKYDKLNEEFIGSLIKSAKNKLSLGFSKMFGSAAKADKIIEEYKNKLVEASAKKRELLKQYALYIKSVSEGGEKDINKINDMRKNIKIAEDNFSKQVENLKKIYDIKLNEVTSDEKNPKIQNYIRLRKLELERELLEEEIKSMFGETDLKEDQLKDSPEFKQMIDEIKGKIKKNEDSKVKEKEELERKEEKILGFDLNKANDMAKRDELYLWEDSPFKKRNFSQGDVITYFSKSNSKDEQNYKGTLATVIEDLGERIKVKTESGNEIEINKGVVISSSDDQKEADEKIKK